jgi:WD40 repeat protein
LSRNHTDLHQLLYDGHRFAQYFANTIKKHPLLLYTTALPFTPTSTSIFKKFYHSRLPKVVCGVEKMWPRQLMQLQGHDDTINSVAFLPDGSKIVSGSSDKTIRVWDASTGVEMLPPLRGHDDLIRSVAFSPNGSKIVSGSDVKTIQVWDASTGNALPCTETAVDDIFMSALDDPMKGEVVHKYQYWQVYGKASCWCRLSVLASSWVYVCRMDDRTQTHTYSFLSAVEITF